MNRDYTERFGIDVEHSDVLDVDPENASATVVADLAAASEVPTAMFDCSILTQTLQYIYDLKAAVEHAHGFCGPAAHSSALSRSRAGSPGASSTPSSAADTGSVLATVR